MSDRELTQEDVETAPLKIVVEVSFADGSKVLSRSFIPKQEWEAMEAQKRQDKVCDGLRAMTDAVVEQIVRRDLTV